MSFNVKNREQTVIIVGAGPTGLRSAIEALKNGKQVKLIEKRTKETYALRPQLVLIHDKTTRDNLHNELKNLPKIINNAINSLNPLNYNLQGLKNELHVIQKTLYRLKKGVIAVKDIQRSLMILIKYTKKYKDNFEFIPDTIVQHIDIEEGYLYAKRSSDNSDRVFYFKYLIGADGARHFTSNQIIDSKDNTIPLVKYKSMGKIPHKQHAAVYLKISRKNGKKLPIPDSHAMLSLSSDKNTYNMLFPPIYNSNNKINNSTKCYFSGEIPKIVSNMINDCDIIESSNLDNILDPQDNKLYFCTKNNNIEYRFLYNGKMESGCFSKSILKSTDSLNKEIASYAHILAYARQCISEYYSEKYNISRNDLDIICVPPSQKHGNKKDKLKLLDFAYKKKSYNQPFGIDIDQDEIVMADKPVYKSENDIYYFPVGDALHTPLYQAGHGLLDGQRDAKALGKWIFGGDINKKKYTENLRNRRKKARNDIKLIHIKPLRNLTVKHINKKINGFKKNDSNNNKIEKIGINSNTYFSKTDKALLVGSADFCVTGCATLIGTAISPGIGTVIGLFIGLVLSIIGTYFSSRSSSDKMDANNVDNTSFPNLKNC